MDVFDLRNRLVDDYRRYTRSFIKIRDSRIQEFVDGILGAEGFWPEPLLQLNPTFSPGGTIDDLVEQGILHRECSRIFDRGAERYGKACYECLLNYGNQPAHKDLDRTLIRGLVAGLARAECRPAGGTGSRAERLAALRKRCDSRLEEYWLERIKALGLRLPSNAQYGIPAYATHPTSTTGMRAPRSTSTGRRTIHRIRSATMTPPPRLPSVWATPSSASTTRMTGWPSCVVARTSSGRQTSDRLR